MSPETGRAAEIEAVLQEQRTRLVQLDMLTGEDQGDSSGALRARRQAQQLRRDIAGEEEELARVRRGEPYVPQSDDIVRDRIVRAYGELGNPNELVSLVRLRAKLDNVPRRQVDRLLKEMRREGAIGLDPDPNRKALPPAAHEAAILLGNDEMHFIYIRALGRSVQRSDAEMQYNRRGEPLFVQREGETPERAAARYRREWAQSPAGKREAARAALRPRVEALAERIRNMDRPEDIAAAIEAEDLPSDALKALADEVDVDLVGFSRTGGRRQINTKAERIAALSELLAQETRKGRGGFR